jgi:hypothetical protein
MQKRRVLCLKFDKVDKIYKFYLTKTLQSISDQSEHYGRISGAYIEISGGYKKHSLKWVAT